MLNRIKWSSCNCHSDNKTCPTLNHFYFHSEIVKRLIKSFIINRLTKHFKGGRMEIAANSSVVILLSFVIKTLKNSHCANLLANWKQFLLFFLSRLNSCKNSVINSLQFVNLFLPFSIQILFKFWYHFLFICFYSILILGPTPWASKILAIKLIMFLLSPDMFSVIFSLKYTFYLCKL